MIDPLMQAAEAWAWRTYRRAAHAMAVRSPVTADDGTVQAIVDLELDEDATPAGTEPIRCIVSLEPDGRISCFKLGQEHETSH